MDTPTTVTIFGSSRCVAGAACYEEARLLGKLLARAGYAVATGGYNGTMEAASRGAAEAGGHVIGVTCDVFERHTTNAWVHEERRTADLMQRMTALADAGDAIVAVMGGVGTLAEVTYVWNLLQIGAMTPRPFLLLGDAWQPIIGAILAHSHIGSSVAALAEVVASPQEILTRLQATLPSPPRSLA
ncbi:MAG: LOG family protein [Anaerolineae bacterium]